MRSVLDTSVLISGIGADLEGELAITSASVAELHFGVLATEDLEIRSLRLRRLVELLELFDPLPMDRAVSASFGRLAAAVTRTERSSRRRTMDLVIVATAHAHGARLYTRNPSDLVGLERLVEIVPVT